MVGHAELGSVVQRRVFRRGDYPVAAPENAVAPRRRPLLFTGVPYVCSRDILVGGNEVERHLKETIEILAFGTNEVDRSY